MSRTRIFSIAGAVVAAAIAAVFMVGGCGGDGNPSNNSGSGSLVLGANEAWVTETCPAGICSGYIFESGGNLKSVASMDNGVTWTSLPIGTWSVGGGNITMTISGVATPIPYSMANNKLTISGTVYVKKNIGGGNGGGDGGSPVLGANEAWVTETCPAGICSGYIFESGGNLKSVASMDNGVTWTSLPIGTWSVSGGNLTMTVSGVATPIPYSMANNKLTIGGTVYVKKNIGGGNGGDGGGIVCAAGEAWMWEDGSPAGEREALIFQAGGVLKAVYEDMGYWTLYTTGTWSTSGNQLTMTTPEGTLTGNYTISGSKLIMIIDGDTEVLTKITGVNLADPGHTHTWGNWIVVTPATCTAPGVEVRICQKDASHTETRPIPQLTGSACDPGHTHTWGNWTAVTPATCTAPGVEVRICQTDATHTETRPIPQLTGSECGHTHTWGNWTVVTPATCTAPGVEVRICQTDATHTETRPIPQLTGAACNHTHTWGNWTVVTPATCTAPGVEIRICQTDATHTETRPIPQLTGAACDPGHTHTWGSWTVVTPATCTAPGVEIRICQTDATHTETRPIPQLTGAACGGSSKFCDYGFGDCEAIASDSECDKSLGIITTACGGGGTYCDFGQPDQYGTGGCFFAPFSVPSGGYSWIASGPGWSQSLTGRCSNKDDDWGWAQVVTQAICVASNTLNPCIADPLKPGDGGGSGPYCTASGGDPLLVCASGEAWVDNYPAGNRDGLIFLANGNLRLIDDYEGYWELWGTGRWSTSGNKLTISISGSTPFTATYSVSGNKLNFDGGTFTKMTGITVQASPSGSMAKQRKSIKKSLLSK